jgi:hypothetical protein
VKAEKILVILGVLAVLALVAGLVAGIMADDSESTDRQEDGGSNAGLIVIFISLLATMNARRQKSEAQQNQEDKA